MRRPVIVLGWLFAALVVGFGSFTLVSLMAHERTRTPVSFTNVDRIELDLAAGGIEIVADAETTEGQTGSVVGQRTVDWGLRRPTISESVSDRTLRLGSSCPAFAGFNCAVRYQLVVPAGIEVVGSSSGGSIRITRVTGNIDVSSSGGSIDVSEPGGRLVLNSSGVESPW